MTRKQQIDVLCRIPIGTPLVVHDGDAAGIVGHFAGLGLKGGADTLKLTGGKRARVELGPDNQPRIDRSVVAEKVPEVLLDAVHMVSMQLPDRVPGGRL